MTEYTVAVFGAGVMGVGISTLAIAHGVPVTLVEVSPDRLERAPARVAHELRLAGLMAATPDGPPGVLSTAGTVEAAAGASIVVEAITESAAAKEKLLGAVAGVVGPWVPVVTNTSSIPIDELAGALTDPAQLVGTHFMNPPYLIRTVEVVRGARTGAATMAAVQDLLAVLRREAVVVRDAPGFVTSRLLHPMINTAARVVQAGTASAADVDALMSGCLGHPTGPLRTADLIGLDNLVDSLAVLYARTGDDACRPCDLLLEKVRSGQLGRKSGRGFYEYEGEWL